MSDSLRTLTCIGGTFFFLAYGSQTKQEAATALLDGMKLLRFFKNFSLNLSERLYGLRVYGRKSTLTTLSLPNSLSEVVAGDKLVRVACVGKSLIDLIQSHNPTSNHRVARQRKIKTRVVLRAGLSWHPLSAISNPRSATILGLCRERPLCYRSGFVHRLTGLHSAEVYFHRSLEHSERTPFGSGLN